MKKTARILITAALFIAAFAITSMAATFSDAWKQDSAGNWYVAKTDGSKVTNAWLCDDAVAANGKDIWYLLDANGNMVSAGLVKDGTGNYYSLETNHNGYFGMLRYKSGTYDGIALTLDSSHNGSFAAIKNADGIEALKAKYGVTDVSNINNSNCVYTSSFSKGGAAAQTAASAGTSSVDERLKYLNAYYGLPTESAEQKNAKMMHVIVDIGRSYADMSNMPLTYAFYQKFLTSIDWPNMSEHDRAEACFNVICCDTGTSNHGYGNGNYYSGAILANESLYERKVPAYHHGVCADYARAYQQLLELVGLKPILHDNQLGGVGHVVVRVSLDGTEYQIDPTNPLDKSLGFDANLYTLDDPWVLEHEL